MSGQLVVAAQSKFPSGLSRLERLPDELKLRIGFYLTAPDAANVASESNAQAEFDDYGWSDASQWQKDSTEVLYRSEGLLDTETYSDSMLALAATSTRLCNVFLNEHSKNYGLQNTLYRSIELGNVNLVHRAVEDGADINEAGTEPPYRTTPLRLAVDSEQLPIILYLLRRKVDKVDELVMDVLLTKCYRERRNQEDTDLAWGRPSLVNHCLCGLLRKLMDATLGSSSSSQGSHTAPRLPRETLEALAPTGRHLWFILRVCMRREWGCDCGDDEGGECPMRLISLLRRCGANWTSCGAYEKLSRAHASWSSLYTSAPGLPLTFSEVHAKGRGITDLARLTSYQCGQIYLCTDNDNPVFIKPSVAGAMNDALMSNTAYKQGHCLPFLTAILEHGVAAERGDLAYAMDLASTSDTKQLSVAIVLALLRAGTDANEPDAMKTAMRLACMDDTKNAAVAFVTLLLEHGADPSEEELQEEIQGAAEKWWIQSTWQSSGVFRHILELLVKSGLDAHIARGIMAVLGLDHDLLVGEGEVGI